MKKIMAAIILTLMLILPGSLFAAGSVTQGITENQNTNIKTLTFSWTGDSADGTVPSTASSTTNTSAIEGMCIYHVITNPGGTAPTALYDIVLNDEDGMDMMGGTLANRSATLTELAVPLLDSTNVVAGCRMVNGTITMVITNQSVNSAVGVIKVFLKRP
jgi:hypothetical protein